VGLGGLIGLDFFYHPYLNLSAVIKNEDEWPRTRSELEHVHMP
jgi:hypothetical protein